MDRQALQFVSRKKVAPLRVLVGRIGRRAERM
jgi:hypothetical protein